MKATNKKKGLFSFYLHNMNKKNEGHFSYNGLTYRLTLFIPGFFVWCSTVGGGGGVGFYLHPVTLRQEKSGSNR